MFYYHIISHNNARDIFSTLNEWDMDIIAEYYTMSAYDNVDWMTFSPVPFNATYQWISYLWEGGTVGIKYFLYHGMHQMELSLLRDANFFTGQSRI